MHSVRMSTTDLLSPDVPPGEAVYTSEEHLVERARLRAGQLKKLSRLILFSPHKPYLDPSNFSVVALEQIKNLPPDINADSRMSFSARTQLRDFEYVGTGIKVWRSMVFARLEEREFLLASYWSITCQD